MDKGLNFWEYLNDPWPLIEGAWVTIKLTSLSVALGLVLSLPLAMAAVSRDVALRTCANVFIEIVRGLALIPFLLFAFYFVPAMIGVPGFDRFHTAVGVFAVSFSAFAADVLRGTINSVPRSHVEAAIAVGMTRPMIVRHVLIPEVFRRALPSLNALVVSLLKLSSMAYVLSVPELYLSATLIHTGRPRPAELSLVVAIGYLALVLPVAAFLRRLERTRWFALEVRRS